MAVVVSLLLAIIGIVVIGCGKSVPKKAAAQSTYEQPQTGRSVPEQPECLKQVEDVFLGFYIA